MLSVAKHLAWRSNHCVSNEASEMLRCAQHDDQLLTI